MKRAGIMSFQVPVKQGEQVGTQLNLAQKDSSGLDLSGTKYELYACSVWRFSGRIDRNDGT